MPPQDTRMVVGLLPTQFQPTAAPAIIAIAAATTLAALAALAT